MLEMKAASPAQFNNVEIHAGIVYLLATVMMTGMFISKTSAGRMYAPVERGAE